MKPNQVLISESGQAVLAHMREFAHSEVSGRVMSSFQNIMETIIFGPYGDRVYVYGDRTSEKGGWYVHNMSLLLVWWIRSEKISPRTTVFSWSIGDGRWVMS